METVNSFIFGQQQTTNCSQFLRPTSNLDTTVRVEITRTLSRKCFDFGAFQVSQKLGGAQIVTWQKVQQNQIWNCQNVQKENNKWNQSNIVK